jgi:hypothetical protein
VARKLESTWQRPVPVSFPPNGAKDLRSWLLGFADCPGSLENTEFLKLLGRDFIEAIQPPELLLSVAAPASRRSGRVAVKAFQWSAAPDAGPIYSDRVDLDSHRCRQQFASAIAKIVPDVDEEDLQQRLLQHIVPEENGRHDQPQVSASFADSVEVGSDGRPSIQVNQRQLRDIRQDAIEALRCANDPPKLFTRAGGIARLSMSLADGQENAPVIQQLSVDAMRGELANVADWGTARNDREGGRRFVSSLPPMEVARDLLALSHIDLPSLAGVITCPVFAPDRSLIVAPGYHAVSGLWHQKTVHDLEPIPTQPDEDELNRAKMAVHEVVADFPFVDEASRVHAIALMIAPFVRHLIDGPTPLFAVDAPTAGTGKDLLVKSVLWPALGFAVGATTAPRDPDEWRKKITSALLDGATAIVLGNIAHHLDTEHLAAVLTDVEWKDRQLGQTRVLTLPNRAIWAATGNNLSFSSEIARRIVWIRLNANVESPDQRSGFRHPRLLNYVRANRGRLVRSVLIMVQSWLSRGQPPGTPVMGSFESFAETLGGILDLAGLPGFLSNARDLQHQAASDTTQWREFVGAWWQRWTSE